MIGKLSLFDLRIQRVQYFAIFRGCGRQYRYIEQQWRVDDDIELFEDLNLICRR